jgi:hypothetical protein
MKSKKLNQNLLLTLMAAILMMGFGVDAKEASTTAVESLDMSQLDGTWIGDYSSLTNGREGYINLTLKSSSNEAIGGLTMIEGKKARLGKPGSSRSTKEKRRPLAITFAQVEGGTIRGTLTPFVDPKSGLNIQTIFNGSLVGDGVIEGTFTSTLTESGHSYTGSWQAVRKD